MSNFIVVVDPDRERRALFAKTVEPLLPPVKGLVTGTCVSGDFLVMWAAAACAPVSQVADEEGAAVLWGEAISAPGSKIMDAKEIRRAWKSPTAFAPPAYDGFYAAVVYHPREGIVAGGDILGIFPLYYYASGDVLLLGSSPELFRHHPSFHMKLDPAGLVGILLTMHILDGQTLLRGVLRLNAGHVLLWRDGPGTAELEHYRIPVTGKYVELPLSAHVEILDRVLNGIIERHASADRKYGLLLSGGLDSRMLGGFLRRKGVKDIVALTIGLPSDLEMECAIPVAHALGFRHRAINITDDEYRDCANLKVRWEHGSNGFNGITHWGLHRCLSGLVHRVVMGYIVDSIVSEPAGAPYSATKNGMSWEPFFTHHNRYGVPAETLKKLLRRELFDGLVEETVNKMRRRYESYSELEYYRAWLFDLHHYVRFHLGSVAWASSFGAWPVLPALDRSLLESAGGMPLATLWGRRGEKELLCTRFPDLAALPLDRNSWDMTPLQPSLRWRLWRLMNSVRWRIRERLAYNQRSPSPGGGNLKGVERRYYYRIYDINGEGWRTVRREAEPGRERVLELFDRDVLDTLLPPPEVTLRPRDAIIEASGLKSLIGFLLWSQEHLT